MKLAKILGGTLVGILILVLFYMVFTGRGQNAPITTAQQQEIKLQRVKSADDPTYAQEIRALTAQLKTAEAEMRAKTVERDQNTRKLQDEISTLNNKIRTMGNDSELKEMQRLVNQVSEQNNNVESENKALREQLSSISQTLNKIEAQQTEKDKQIAALNEQLVGAREFDEIALEDRVKEIFDRNFSGSNDEQAMRPGLSPEQDTPQNIPYETSKRVSHKPYGVTLDQNGQMESTLGLGSANLDNFFGAINEAADKNILPMKELGVENPATTTVTTEAAVEKKEVKLITKFPVYTLPPTTMFTDSVLLTPLIGRVPVGGNVNDPFRFQLEIGAENLAANGHSIPGIKKAIVSGIATGIREQSCVRGAIDTMTFIFEDGRISTTGNSSSLKNSNGGLGYLTDPQGKPCVYGQYVNNASAYLKDRSLAAFLQGLATAYASSNINYENNEGTISSYISGNTYQYAAAQGLAGTAEEIAEYISERAQNAFDVVYVPQATNVQIILQESVEIDYDTKGRKVNYLNSHHGVSYD